MTVNLYVQPYHTLTPPNFFHNIGLADPMIQRFKVDRVAMSRYFYEPPTGSYTVFVSQNVLNALGNKNARLNNSEGIDLKFLASILGRNDLANRANAAINKLEFELNDLKDTSSLPTTTKKWELKLKPSPETREIEILKVIEQFKESITFIDLTDLNTRNQNTLFIAIIKHCKNLEHLKIIGEHFRLDSFQNFDTLFKLSHFEIIGCPVTPSFAGMNQLRTLKFDTAYGFKTTPDLTPLTHLDHLTLQGNTETDITRLRSLKSLHLDQEAAKNCPADLTLFPELTSLHTTLLNQTVPRMNAAKITSLVLRCERNRSDLNFLAPFANLKTLHLIQWSALKDVSVLSTLTKLASLVLNDCQELEEIPDLTNTELEVLGLSSNPKLKKVPNLTGSNKLKIVTFWNNTLIKEIKIINDPNFTNMEYAYSNLSLLHLENLPLCKSLSTLARVIQKIVLKDLKFLSFDFSLTEATEVSIINMPFVKRIYLNGGITHLELIDLPNLNELMIKDFPLMETMELPPFVEREGREILKFQPVAPNLKNQFLATLSKQLERTNFELE